MKYFIKVLYKGNLIDKVEVDALDENSAHVKVMTDAFEEITTEEGG